MGQIFHIRLGYTLRMKNNLLCRRNKGPRTACCLALAVGTNIIRLEEHEEWMRSRS